MASRGGEQTWRAVRSLLRAQQDAPHIEAHSLTPTAPASFGQRSLWFLENLHPSAAYNLGVAFRLLGPLDVRALERSFSELVRRHETLRTTFALVDGEPIQVVSPPWAVDLPLADSPHPAHAKEPFDLAHGPLLRLRLSEIGHQEYHLQMAVHHTVFDGWSFEIFMRELGLLYQAFSAGRESPLAKPVLQYRDYAVWQRARLADGRFPALLEYWRGQMSGVRPALRLPVDRPRRSQERRPNASHTLDLTRELTDALNSLAAREGTTLFTVLLAAFQTLLYRYTGETDVVVGSPVANRPRLELREIIGLFVNTLPLRTDLAGEPSFRELLRRVGTTVTGAYAHQELPFELMVEEMRPQRSLGHSPLFQVMFAFHNMPRTSWSLPGLNVDAWPVESGAAMFDLTLFMEETVGGLRARLEYDSGLFEPATASRMLNHLAMLLREIVRNPEQSIARLALLSPAERHELLADGNDTTVPYPRDQPIHRVFEHQARQRPEAVAITWEQGTLSYRELNRRANRLARQLRRMELAPEALVGIRLDRTPALVVSLLAVCKAGGAYLPVDPSPSLPQRRTAALLQHAAVLVTDPELQSGPGAPVVPRTISPDSRPSTDADDENDPQDASADRLAYVMFTSGSTGKPKGVCVTHRGVVRLVCGASYANLSAEEVFLQLAPVAFDASTFEIWGALLNGATLALAPPGRLSLSEMGATIRRFGVTTLWLTSGLFELFVDSNIDALAAVRQLLVGGDVMSISHAAIFVERMKSCRLINAYGPTENTTFTCTYPVERVEPGCPIPIGRPISNTQIFVLDQHRQPVPRGVLGEAYVGGDGLARGYLDDPEETRARFVPSPFAEAARLYRTGDRVRLRSDGNLEFAGRTDDQVKVRGFRVEPAEVELALGQHPDVTRAAVVARANSLVAYIVPRVLDSRLTARLTGFLRSQLPDYMVPSAIVTLPELPLTANGKLDRNALPAPAPACSGAPADPSDDLERQLTSIFHEVLGVPAVRIRDSFFDLGGHSLLLLRLAARLETELALPIPLASLYVNDTVAELAHYLRQRREAQAHGDDPCLVVIKEGRSTQPLFLAAGGQGGMVEMPLYAKLAARLPGDRTVYGLLAPRDQGSTSIEEMVVGHLERIRRLQPRGPYFLGGLCTGGVVAFEIARRMHVAHERVALLLLIDSWCPTDAGSLHHRLVGGPWAKLKAGLAFLAKLPQRRQAGTESWLAELRRRALVPPSAKRFIKACMDYRPGPYPGDVTLLASAASLRRGIVRDWQRVIQGRVSVHSAPGNHESFVRTYINETAEALRTCLESVPEWRQLT